MQTYLFYDIETTGLNKSFDQVLQFAAIRTDLNLKELDRYEIKVKLNPDVIPSPRAVITHHIGIKQMMDGISEVEAIHKIHRLMNEPGTISLGYNTLGFDDEFLRFSFYRNLLPPYTHQFANQCSRMDLYPMTIMYFLFKKTAIKWPQKEGKISLKLEELNKANQLATGRAHDAMVDVEATLKLAHYFHRDREMWDYLIGFYNKQIDQERSRHPNALMVYGKLGYDLNFLSPVLLLGNHRHYKNQSIWLRLDLENLSTTTEETIPETTWVMRKKLGEPGFLLPLKDRYEAQVKPESLKLAESNKKWLQQNSHLMDKIVNYHLTFKYPEVPHADIDARLYLDSFWSDEDHYSCRRFHSAAPKEKAQAAENIRNPKLRALAVRLLGRHYSSLLTDSQAETFTVHLQKMKDENNTPVDFRGEKRLTPQAALDDIAVLRKEALSDEQRMLLDELQAYVTV